MPTLEYPEFFEIEAFFFPLSLFSLLAAFWLKCDWSLFFFFFSLAPSSPCTFWNAVMVGGFSSSLMLVALEGDRSAPWG